MYSTFFPTYESPSEATFSGPYFRKNPYFTPCGSHDDSVEEGWVNIAPNELEFASQAQWYGVRDPTGTGSGLRTHNQELPEGVPNGHPSFYHLAENPNYGFPESFHFAHAKDQEGGDVYHQILPASSQSPVSDLEHNAIIRRIHGT